MKKTFWQFVAGFFQEDNGNSSNMRLVTFIIVSVALFLSIYQTVITDNHSFEVASIATLITLAITGKLIQKPQEEKVDTPITLNSVKDDIKEVVETVVEQTK